MRGSVHGSVRALRPAVAFPVLFALIALGGPTTLQAAEPVSGSVGPENLEITWEGKYFERARTFFGPDHCPPERDPGGTLCDHFMLTVDVEPGYWEGRDGGVWLSITFESRPHQASDISAGHTYDDFDLHVYRAGKLIASSLTRSRTTLEEVFVRSASGSYEVRVVPKTIVKQGYEGNARFVSGPHQEPSSENQAYRGVRIHGNNPDVEPQSTPADYASGPLTLQAVDVGFNAVEPTLGIDPSGTVFYDAAPADGVITPLANHTRSKVLRSRDGGLTWEDVQPAIAGNSVHPGTRDPYLYVDDESGRVFLIDLVGGLGCCDWSQLSFSDDQGSSWTTTAVTNPTGPGNDRQWLTSGPVPPGSPLRTLDPDFDRILYYCVNQWIHTGCSRSLDGGRTFVPTEEKPFPGFNPDTGAFCTAYTGDGFTDAEGRFFIPRLFCDEGGDTVALLSHVALDTPLEVYNEIPMLAVSQDAGATWQRSVVSARIRGVNGLSPAAVDSEGNLYYTWYDKKHRLPYLATSTDHGRTWSDPLMIAPPGVHEANFPTVVAGDAGRIAVLFVGSTTEDQTDLTRPWNAYVTVSINALSESPTFVSALVNDSADPIHRGDCELKCAWMLDFLDIQISPSDGGVWAAIVDTCTNVERCRTEARPGNTHGGDRGVAKDYRGIAVRQLSGPWLRAPA